ncbi:MAG TPA: hypothetical protein PK443_05675, partial [bacterium]|nr:hypothetical protein [bacterium]
MKKVLVLASLGLLALSFGCGGSDGNNDDDAATEGQSAFIFNSMIPAIVDGTQSAVDQIADLDSVSINSSTIELTPITL